MKSQLSNNDKKLFELIPNNTRKEHRSSYVFENRNSKGSKIYT